MKSNVKSFQVDHLLMECGIEERSHTFAVLAPIKSFDVRIYAPKEERYITPAAMHTIEHFMAHYMRELGDIKGEDVISVHPMGCLTGIYVIVKGFYSRAKITYAIFRALDYTRDNLMAGVECPGLTKKECGNPSLVDYPGAIKALTHILCNYKLK